MKKIFLLAAIVFAMAAHAQVTKVSIQASGLTCSLCSNAINKALKSLDFIDKVEPNLKNSTFDVTFKPGSKVDFDKLKNKVEGAGFSVANFSASILFNNVRIKPDENVVVGDKVLRFVNVKEQTLNGIRPVRVVDKGFVPAREYKKNNVATADNKVYHVTI